ncbi:MAG: arabinogalactan endo-1,4-beta-galactosidase [Chitinophagaceae bacterium]|nr:MAG: arabinogalactan endo-1,4-beta-galactosidase [Chitinophagaceae bacterium]
MKKLLVLPLLLLLGACGKKETAPAPATPAPPAADTFQLAKGADVSWITELESAGKRFYDAGGTQREGMALLKSLGMNTIRLRVWVNPAGGWNNKADVLAKAQRAKALGMRLMIDFHYSDSWADPGQQTKPVSWAALDFNGLRSALATHTTDVLATLQNAGITPEWVQVGNETNNGMLWPDGRASTNMSNFAQLVNSGYDAVKGVFPNAKVIVHLSNGSDNALYRWLFDGLLSNGARWDVIGLSLYPDINGWGNINVQALNNMNDMVTRYGKEVMVVEVGMPWDSPDRCGQFLADLIAKVRSVPNHKGLGVLYWEPETPPGWSGYTLGAFDNNGRPTIALNAFQ